MTVGGRLIENNADIPIPVAATCDGLVKRLNDSISGDEPFIDTVRMMKW